MSLLCPNCRSLTSRWKYCEYCNCSIESLLPQTPDFVPMDPRLHQACAYHQQGIPSPATASTKPEEVAILARVTDVEEFKRIAQAQILTCLPPCATDKEQITLLTARMPAALIKQVRQQQNIVLNLKASSRIRTCLEKTLEKSAAEVDEQGILPNGQRSNGGRRVIIGIVDFGLDFVHHNFRHAKGSSRILALWDQKNPNNDSSRFPKGFGYGREFTKAELDAALKQLQPEKDFDYRAFGYGPPEDALAQIGAHGTYVTDVAAGNGEGTGCSGLAPEADIVFVDVGTFRDVEGPDVAFSDSAQLVEAVDYIFRIADEHNKPCVVNISLGTNGGPHDGSTLVEQALDYFVTQKPNRAIVIAAGNAFGEDLHAKGRVPPGGWADLTWLIPNNDPTSNELEVWYDTEGQFTAEIINPEGAIIAHVLPDEKWATTVNDIEIMTVINRVKDSGNQKNHIQIFFKNGVPHGQWKLRLRDSSADKKGSNYHAWIERDDAGQARFLHTPEQAPEAYQITDSHTLNSIANGKHTIVVGSYNAHDENLTLGENTASGPTSDGRDKPDLIAPGEKVFAAHSRTRVLRRRQSGTSMAAPVVSGVVALLLAEARAKRRPLPAKKIRDLLIKSASGQGQWDQGEGYGRVSAAAALDLTRDWLKEKGSAQKSSAKKGPSKKSASRK